MSQARPDFINSEYFYADDDGWHLRDAAPANIKKEFEEYMSITEDIDV